MTIIGWPPRLAVCHQRGKVVFQRLIIELLERLGIVKFLAHRVGRHAMLMKHVDGQSVRPPVLILSSEQRTHLDFTARTHWATITWICICHSNFSYFVVV